MARRQAVLVIDMVDDLVTGKLACDRGRALVPRLRRLLDGAREAGVPIVFSGDAHLPEDFELRVWGEHAMAGTEGAETVPELQPREGDWELPKRTYSAFFETGLDQLLRSLEVDEVVICGLHTDMCDRHTAADAFFRGYEVAVPEDGVEAFTQEAHESGLEYLENVYGARITSTDGLFEEWEVARTTRRRP